MLLVRIIIFFIILNCKKSLDNLFYLEKISDVKAKHPIKKNIRIKFNILLATRLIQVAKS